MSRRKFLKQSSIATLGLLTHPMYGSALSYSSNKDVIIGHNTHRYKVDMSWGDLDPLKTPVKDCHEMVQDSKGRIVLLTNHTKNNIIIYDKSGKLLETWGTQYPGGHGLTHAKENGEDFLFITDYERHQVIKTTIDGKVVLEIDYPADTGFYSKKEAFKPTETTVLENGDFYIADGYGNQHIIHYNHKGELINIFGGIVRCDRVAQGVIDAYKNMGNINVPIIVRLQGTNADIAKELIDNSGLDVLSATEFQEAADKVQQVLA